MFNIQKDFYFLMKYNSREPVERRFPIKKRGDEFKKNMSLHTEGFFFFLEGSVFTVMPWLVNCQLQHSVASFVVILFSDVTEVIWGDRIFTSREGLFIVALQNLPDCQQTCDSINISIYRKE